MKKPKEKKDVLSECQLHEIGGVGFFQQKQLTERKINNTVLEGKYLPVDVVDASCVCEVVDLPLSLDLLALGAGTPSESDRGLFAEVDSESPP